MGNIFRKQTTRALPNGAEFFTKAGDRFARWQSRGKTFTAELTGSQETPRIVTHSKTFTARYRDHNGIVVERPTGCRDRQAAEQLLRKWEREVEQIRAGILDPKQLESARASSTNLETHLASYEQSLIARNVSAVYRSNTLRAVRRLADDLGFGCIKDISRWAVESWLAKVLGEGMSARSRNHYRDAMVIFLNWCKESNLISNHDLNKLPKADVREDPRRQRRSLTEDEINRLLTVTATRPLDDTRTIRRGAKRGQRSAEVRPEVIAHLEAVGRERVLAYKTLLFTGLRLNELRTLTVSQLDLTPGAELLKLEAKNEKNRAGSALPLRSDLAAEFRIWIKERKLSPSDTLFMISGGLCRILDRDLEAAGIPKRDDRGRTIDVHSLRTTFCTMLSKFGTNPRTAQAAMRHSDIKLTMNTYTDPALLNIREAVERLPSIPQLSSNGEVQVALHVARLADNLGQNLSLPDTQARLSGDSGQPVSVQKSTGNSNEKAPVTSDDITGAESGWRDLNPRPLDPQSSALAKLRYSPFRH